MYCSGSNNGENSNNRSNPISIGSILNPTDDNNSSLADNPESTVNNTQLVENNQEQRISNPDSPPCTPPSPTYTDIIGRYEPRSSDFED